MRSPAPHHPSQPRGGHSWPLHAPWRGRGPRRLAPGAALWRGRRRRCWRGAKVGRKCAGGGGAAHRAWGGGLAALGVEVGRRVVGLAVEIEPLPLWADEDALLGVLPCAAHTQSASSLPRLASRALRCAECGADCGKRRGAPVQSLGCPDRGSHGAAKPSSICGACAGWGGAEGAPWLEAAAQRTASGAGLRSDRRASVGGGVGRLDRRSVGPEQRLGARVVGVEPVRLTDAASSRHSQRRWQRRLAPASAHNNERWCGWRATWKGSGEEMGVLAAAIPRTYLRGGPPPRSADGCSARPCPERMQQDSSARAIDYTSGELCNRI
eukprot:SAG11_NODE_432_length_9520_cov_102.527863_7_plen_324_part_00